MAILHFRNVFACNSLDFTENDSKTAERNVRAHNDLRDVEILFSG